MKKNAGLLYLTVIALAACTGTTNTGKTPIDKSPADPASDLAHTALDYSEMALNALTTARSVVSYAYPEAVTAAKPAGAVEESNPCKPPKKKTEGKANEYTRTYENCNDGKGTQTKGRITYTVDDKDVWTIAGELVIAPKEGKPYQLRVNTVAARIKKDDGTYRYTLKLVTLDTWEDGAEYADSRVATTIEFDGTDLLSASVEKLHLQRILIKKMETLPVYFEMNSPEKGSAKIKFSPACYNPIGKFAYTVYAFGKKRGVGNIEANGEKIMSQGVHHTWSKACKEAAAPASPPAAEPASDN